MAYDNTSVTGDEICDYYYDIENNFMNPPSPTGYFIYTVLGGAFDRIAELVNQFRIDYSILDCNVGNVEIVKSFPEVPDTTHMYYVAQYATAEERVFTKYSYVDGEWVTETVTGDVLNSLDTFWGRSYNLLRLILYEGSHREYLFEDACTISDNKSDGYFVYVGTTSFDENGLTLSSVYNSGQYQMNVRLHNQVETVPFTVEFDMVSNNTDKAKLYFYRNGFTGTAIGGGTLWTSPQNEVTHFKFTVTKDSITRTVNGTTTTIANTGITDTVGVRFGYYQNTDGYIKIKNYKVYQGEGKERPLTDEEYKIYLYLRNHRLLTQKDVLVAFGNCFGDVSIGQQTIASIRAVNHKMYDNPPFTNETLAAYDPNDTGIVIDTKHTGVDSDPVIDKKTTTSTLTITIPEGYDENFLTLLAEYASIKGNVLISMED